MAHSSLSLTVKKSAKLDEEEYDKRLEKLQGELARIQQSYITQGLKAVLVFEGVDAAGKGGLIRRIAWALDPRGFKVWPISKPNEEEAKEHYLQRFWLRLPRSGSIAAFDRSWYGRVLVERVEELTPARDWKRAFDEINTFEKMLVDDGTKVIKIFLHISFKEQAERFADRMKEPEKRWKLSFEDFRNREKWDDYLKAFGDMFKKTSTREAPWKVIANDSKHGARLEAMEHIVSQLSKGVEIHPPEVDPRLKKLAKKLHI